MENGTKFDDKKTDYTLVNQEFMEACSRAMQNGIKKYGRENYKGGLTYIRLIRALLGHTYSFLNRKDPDKDSGLSHLDHLCACANMLAYMVENRPDLDDRYTKEKK